MIHALVASGDETRTARSGRDRLEEIDVVDGTIFHLYAIEDEGFPPLPAAAAPARDEDFHRPELQHRLEIKRLKRLKEKD